MKGYAMLTRGPRAFRGMRVVKTLTEIAKRAGRGLSRAAQALKIADMTDVAAYAASLAAGVALLVYITLSVTLPRIDRMSAVKTITVNDDGVSVAFITTLDTVGELFAAYGIKTGEADEVSAGPDSEISDGGYVSIRRAMTVYLLENSRDAYEQQVTILSGTVADALSASIYASATDSIVSPPRTQPLSPGIVIKIDQVTRSIETTTERVYYKLITQKDPNLDIGKTQVVTPGREGEKTVNYEVVYVNGEEVSRRKISEIITTPAVDKVVSEGTRIPATPRPTRSATKTPTPTRTPAPTATVTNDNTIIIDGKTYTYTETLVVTATAYTHTGNKTASGKWPKVGMMAVDRSIMPFGTRAYVPGYGIAVAEDVGGFRGLQIDLFMDTYNECMLWGRKRNLTIYILE